jgi:DMSO reductase anchor subunit
MHPAFSVIFLTTLIGAGQGLMLALFTVQAYAQFGVMPAADAGFHVKGSLLVLALLAAGLFASFFHLGRPERAWRAATQWRTSWLSREVIVLPLFMGAVALYAISHALGWQVVAVTLPGGVAIDLPTLLGALAALLALALFVCTGMIYACLRFLREWHTPLTVMNFILLGTASGFTLAAACAAHLAPALTAFYVGWALILTVLAALGRLASLWRNQRLRPVSSLQTAIGIKHPHIRQTSMGFMGGAFNTREFFHGRSAGCLRWVKGAFLLGAFVLPLALLAAGSGGQASLLTVAFIVQYVGLLAERWFFFAQAQHPQNLYYQRVS